MYIIDGSFADIQTNLLTVTKCNDVSSEDKTSGGFKGGK